MIGRGYNYEVGELNDAQTRSHTMHHEIAPSTTWLFINIDLGVDYRCNVPQNVPTFHGHVSQGFFTILDVIPHV
jgi:hypothetical protein